MSFRCSICNAIQPDHTQPIKITLETRKVIYPERMGKDGKPPYERDVVIDSGGEGMETVQEADACEECAKRFGGNDKSV